MTQTTPAYRIAVVCLGNICRSPIAEVVLAAHLSAVGLGREVEVESAGTAGFHVGKPMDPRAAAALEQAGYDPSRHRARRFTAEWFDRFDLVLAMDAANLTTLKAQARSAHTTVPVRMFRSFDPETKAGPDPGRDPGTDPGADRALDLADPYYGDASDFAETVRTVERTCARIATILTNSMSL